MLSEDDTKKPSTEDQKVADAMMDELEALMKPGSVYVSLIQQFFCSCLNQFCYVRPCVVCLMQTVGFDYFTVDKPLRPFIVICLCMHVSRMKETQANKQDEVKSVKHSSSKEHKRYD